MTTALPAHVPLAVTTRGAHVENVHCGSLAVVARDGQVIAHCGDVDAEIYARSTIKPFQALPFLMRGGPARFGWGEAELAMLCASHSGEAVHLQVVEGMLASSGHRIEQLGCGAHVPLYYAAIKETPPPAMWTALHNNCSGKHAGFLAGCALEGWSRDDYLAFDHPLQQAIREALGRCSGCNVDRLPRGIDGCSAPNYALPVANLATAMANLAQADLPGGYAAPLQRLRDAMRARPELVSGTARFDLLLARAGQGDWLAKVGAEGVQVVASVSRGCGIAIKLADGNLRVLQTVTVEVLRQLGWLDAAAAAVLADWAEPALRNWRGTTTGVVRACLQLNRQ